MKNLYPFSHCGQQLYLSCNRYIYWKEQRTIILSDLHLGKPAHFRKNGISIPTSAFQNDIRRLQKAIELHNPDKFLVIGDFFHSEHNAEHDAFLQWRNQHPNIQIQLVKGNHDILQPDWYQHANIELIEEKYYAGPFAFMHHRYETSEKCFTFSGHIHPGITLTGPAKQRIHLPCFYFGRTFALLPAFGRFTGSISVEMKKDDRVFALTHSEILAFDGDNPNAYI